MNTAIQAAFDHALLASAAFGNLAKDDTGAILTSKLTDWPASLVPVARVEHGK